jgi:hypothetical protein
MEGVIIFTDQSIDPVFSEEGYDIFFGQFMPLGITSNFSVNLRSGKINMHFIFLCEVPIRYYCTGMEIALIFITNVIPCCEFNSGKIYWKKW